MQGRASASALRLPDPDPTLPLTLTLSLTLTLTHTLTLAQEGEAGFGMWFDQGAPWQHAASEAALLQPPQAAWSNPLLSALPYAPSLKIHCLYGVGLPTERGYAVRDVGPDTAEAPALAIDRAVNGLGANGVAVSNGVLLTDGDGSAPVLSLGYMCQSGWRRAALNPSRSAVTLREYRHRGPEQDAAYGVPQPLARSPTSADHVDILGNHELLRDVLAIVSGGAVEERLVSDVEGIAARVDARISRAIVSAASRRA